MATIEEIIGAAESYLHGVDLTPLRQSHEFAVRIYEGRKHLISGLPYLEHALEVARILVLMRLDQQTVVAGLLHGVLKENAALTMEELQKDFGEDVANIVRGTTRITNVRFDSKLTYQAENVRKLLLAMASDIRVLLVRLADRLHDMRSLNAGDSVKTMELSQETMDLYAPLASRLGIDWMKRELEDLAFRYLYPDEYEDLARKIESSLEDRENYVKKVIRILDGKLRENHLKDFQIIGRPKHLYSTYKKIIAQKIPVEKVYDKVAFRIIVDTVKDCYEVLGIVHANWYPIPGRIKDFISTPKANNYQSMHTTVLGPHGEFMEVQIRTHEMDKVAQEGVAAHWAYKEGQKISPDDARVFTGLKQLIQWLQDLKDPREFLDSVKGELFDPDVYALTPRGEVKEFPGGSTPIDFAYSIHTEVGDHCIGAKVNGRIVPLKYQLMTGDMVEIITSPGQRPRRGWLSLVMTSRAKSRIRHWLRREEQEKAVSLGRELFERELHKENTSLKKIAKTGHLKKLLKIFRSNSLEELLGKIGAGNPTVKNVFKELQPEELRIEAPATEQAQETVPVKEYSGAEDEGIRIDGASGMLVKISRCCLPVPGDKIVGFITVGRGVSVHKASCPNLLATDAERRLEVNWSTRSGASHRAQIRVLVQDKKGMLAAVSATISKDDANILELNVRTTPDNLATINAVVEINNLQHLKTILQHLRQVDGVVEADRK